MNNLVFHYQPVIHGVNALVLHEAFSTRSGELYSLNPIPVEVKGDTEEEMEITLKAMEADSARYKPVRLNKITREVLRWKDEVAVTTNPKYDDEDDLEEDYYGTDGEVLDLCEYFERNK